MSVMEVLTLLLVIFAALSYIDNHKKNAGSAACVPRIYCVNSCLASTKITAISYRTKRNKHPNRLK